MSIPGKLAYRYEETMNKPDTFDIMDKGLNERLDRLERTIDSTNRTLESVSKDLINASERQSRLQNKFQIIYLVLTTFIVIVAASSAYFAYKSVRISSGQKSLQTAQVILDIVTTVKETLQDLQTNSIDEKNDFKGEIDSGKEKHTIEKNSEALEEKSQAVNESKNKN